jgi:hypothetical protein
VDAQETYRSSAADLEFGELLPPQRGAIEQTDYEERTAIGFQLERLTKRLGEPGCRAAAATEQWAPPGYRATRVDAPDGIDTVMYERIDESE